MESKWPRKKGLVKEDSSKATTRAESTMEASEQYKCHNTAKVKKMLLSSGNDIFSYFNESTWPVDAG